MSLHTIYRPESFKNFIGNEDVINSLDILLRRENIPSSFLFTGGSGYGKTTLARIIKSELKCSNSDFIELNAADDRGIEAIRNLIENMYFSPINGDKKLILLDECFSPDTLIYTTRGDIRIDEVKVGDTVYNLNGIDTVEKIFINKVPLERVVKITKSSGKVTYCTQDHKFYHNGEWIDACNLNRKKIALWRRSRNKVITYIQEIVEKIEFYFPGKNEELFSDVFTEKDIENEYIEFYDLQIKNNHSYIANRNMVHNCHMLTKPSQEALLKALEEPPSHIHWVLCTTNPEALKPTLKRRCHTYELEPLSDSEVHRLMKNILKKENRESLSLSVRDKIAELSDGSAGQVLKLLDQIIDMEEKQALSILKSSGTTESEVKNICRILVNSNMNTNTKWAKLKILLKNYRGDGESARRHILSYLEKVLLNNGSMEVAFIMDEFRENLYDSGKPGLILACYKAIFGGESE